MVATIARLREVFHYDPENGSLTWKVRTSNRIRVGDEATCPNYGYYVVRLDTVLYRAHRVCWAVHYGAWPVSKIDHINGNRNDNRLCNLREATIKENCRNMRIGKANKSGYKGVAWGKVAGKWSAQIKVNYRKVHLGLFNDPAEAHAAYVEAAAKYYGEFANDGYGPICP